MALLTGITSLTFNSSLSSHKCVFCQASTSDLRMALKLTHSSLASLNTEIGNLNLVYKMWGPEKGRWIWATNTVLCCGLEHHQLVYLRAPVAFGSLSAERFGVIQIENLIVASNTKGMLKCTTVFSLPACCSWPQNSIG